MLEGRQKAIKQKPNFVLRNYHKQTESARQRSDKVGKHPQLPAHPQRILAASSTLRTMCPGRPSGWATAQAVERHRGGWWPTPRYDTRIPASGTHRPPAYGRYLRIGQQPPQPKRQTTTELVRGCQGGGPTTQASKYAERRRESVIKAEMGVLG